MNISELYRGCSSSALLEGFETRRDQEVALVYEKTTSAELQSHIENLKSSLKNVLGLCKGDRVGIVAENRRQWLKFFLAVTASGGIAVPISPDTDPAKKRFILKHAGVQIIMTSLDGLGPVENHFLKGMEGIKQVVLLDHHRCQHFIMPEGVKVHDFRTMLTYPVKDSPSMLSDDDPAVICYTSGTSGEPKGIVLSHGNLTANVQAISRRVRVFATDNVAIILPLNHSFPLIIALTALYNNATIILASSHKRFAEIIRATHPSIIITVPLMLAKIRDGILKKIESEPFPVRVLFRLARFLVAAVHRTCGVNLSFIVCSGVRSKFPGLRFFVSGGASLAPELLKDLIHLGLPVINGYGTTELSPVVAVQAYEENLFKYSRYYLDHAGECGPLLDNLEARIDPTTGCLHVSGPSLMLGYYNDQESDASLISNENGKRWFNTSDVAEFRPDGSLAIYGRFDNVLNLANGKRISAESIRQDLLTDPLVSDAWAYSDRGSRRGSEVLKAAVYLNPERLRELGLDENSSFERFEDLARECRRRLNCGLEQASRISEIVLLNEPIPLTTKGTVRYNEVIRRAENASFDPKKFFASTGTVQ
ncbi:MAG: AMP-binding protein [Candidatus Wallbacteria bacterium]|nr:AMP-binding protein [Candidatus Wallbacteria bacterium]